MTVTFPTLPETLEHLSDPCSTIRDADKFKVARPKTSPRPAGLSPNHRSTDVEAYLMNLKEYEAEVAAYQPVKKEIDDHNYKVDQLIVRFIWDVSGLNRHVPEQYRGKLWDMAYSDGHSDGYCQILNELVRLVEIFE